MQMNTIQPNIQNGRKALSEFHSKNMLRDHGIPTTTEELVQHPEEALQAAERIGYPVALKACSPELMHKSEIGCVELGLAGPDAVRTAYDRILKKMSFPLEGVLVQEMLAGQREIVVGLTRAPQFGPCVMVGLGGIMAEVMKDTAFRVAPFDRVEAMDMLDELKARPLLDAFRGQAPADLETICRVLTAVGRIGLEHDEIAEIDINPLIISTDGTVTAADALIVLGRE